MNILAITGALNASRLGGLAMISGALLGAAGGPAFSADLPYDYTYRPTYECYECRRPAPIVERVPVPVPIERPAVEVAERHWVQRDYFERHYPYYAPEVYSRYRYSYYPAPDYPAPEYYPPYEHHHPRCVHRCGDVYSSYVPPVGEPRRKFAYGGGLPYQPVAVAYQHERESQVAYPPYGDPARPFDYYRPVYEPGYKPADEYQPRPPAPVPSAYYGPGYAE